MEAVTTSIVAIGKQNRCFLMSTTFHFSSFRNSIVAISRLRRDRAANRRQQLTAKQLNSLIMPRRLSGGPYHEDESVKVGGLGLVPFHEGWLRNRDSGAELVSKSCSLSVYFGTNLLHRYRGTA